MSRYIKASAAAGRALPVNGLRAAVTDGSSDGFRMSQTAVAMYPTTRTDWDLAPKARLYLAKDLALFVRKYRQKYRPLRNCLYRQLRRQLYGELNLALYRDLNTSLYRALFEKTYESLLRQLLTTLFGSLFDLKYGEL